VWFGPLSDSVYRPDVSCTTQPMPDLTQRASTAQSTAAVASYRTLGHSQAPPAGSGNAFRQLLNSPKQLLATVKAGGR